MKAPFNENRDINKQKQKINIWINKRERENRPLSIYVASGVDKILVYSREKCHSVEPYFFSHSRCTSYMQPFLKVIKR